MVDWLIEKKQAGFQMVNSVQQLKEIVEPKTRKACSLRQSPPASAPIRKIQGENCGKDRPSPRLAVHRQDCVMDVGNPFRDC